jgi:O-antigen/teichoic acid export membrane protein
MSEGNQSAGRRLSVITIDQAIAGASNVLIAVLAARLLDVASFGLFGIVFLVYVLVQGVSRALVCDPLLVHPVEGQGRLGEVIGTSCVLGPALGAGVLAAGLAAHVFDARLGDALLVLAVCVPLLVLQDLGRYVAFAVQRPAAALVLDVAWLALQLAAVGALFLTDTRTLPWFIAAWAGSGAVAGTLLFVQHRSHTVRLSLSWLRYTWSFSWRYLISYTSTIGAALAASVAVGAIAGSKALGGLQGAMLLVRPFMTFQVAAIAASIGEVSRSDARDPQLRRHVARTSAVTTTIALVNMGVLLVLPDRIGEMALGASWDTAKPLLLATGVQIVCLGSMTGVRAGLLGVRAIRKVMVIDVVTTVAILILTIPGAVIDGARGALWAVTLGQGVMAVVWWMTFLTHTGRREPLTTAAGPLPSVPVPGTPPA